MGKTIDTSELLYRMGKYAEINVGEEGHDHLAKDAYNEANNALKMVKEKLGL